MEYMMMPLQRYADFSGRSRRKEFWMFELGLLIVGLVIGLLTGSLVSGGSGGMSGLGMGIFGLFYLAILVPAIAVMVRRFHDQDKSGWFVLLSFVPVIGGLVLLVFMCLEGTHGDNQYGPDPKAGEH